MGSALRDVWVRASCGDPVFSYDDVHRWRQDEFERLVRMGVLRETAQARYILCDACTEGHREEVVWQISVRTPTGMRGYIPCPEERSVPVDPERLRQWAVDAGTLARLIAAVTELSGPVEEKTRGFWYLGRRRVAGRFREFCLAVRPGADALNSARTYSAPVVLAVDLIGAWKESGIATFFLPDVASLAGDRLVVDLDYIEDGAAWTRSGGPSLRRYRIVRRTRPLARTPGVRLIVIGKEVRTVAADPEVRVVAIPRERRVLVPAAEQRTLAVPAENRSIAA